MITAIFWALSVRPPPHMAGGKGRWAQMTIAQGRGKMGKAKGPVPYYKPILPRPTLRDSPGWQQSHEE